MGAREGRRSARETREGERESEGNGSATGAAEVERSARWVDRRGLAVAMRVCVDVVCESGTRPASARRPGRRVIRLLRARARSTPAVRKMLSPRGFSRRIRGDASPAVRGRRLARWRLAL